jgi:hypothetical protein
MTVCPSAGHGDDEWETNAAQRDMAAEGCRGGSFISDENYRPTGLDKGLATFICSRVLTAVVWGSELLQSAKAAW